MRGSKYEDENDPVSDNKRVLGVGSVTGKIEAGGYLFCCTPTLF